MSTAKELNAQKKKASKRTGTPKGRNQWEPDQTQGCSEEEAIKYQGSGQ